MSYQYDVIGLGIASWDYIGVAAHELLLGAKQPLAQWIEAGGGPVATALVTLARFGMRTALVSAVGNDEYGQHIIGALQQEGVDTESVQVHPGQSHVAFALVEPSTGRRTIWWHNDRSVLDALTIDQSRIVSARLLHVDTHMPDVALVAARWMRSAGGLVTIDAERYRENTAAILPYCDAIIVSERFGREATGEISPELSAQALFRRYHTLIVVTSGEQGCWCVHAGEAFHTPAFAVDVVDTTGAGDVFHGAFIYGILQRWSIRNIARFASATAALKCRLHGGRAGIPSREEIDDLMNAP